MAILKKRLPLLALAGLLAMALIGAAQAGGKYKKGASANVVEALVSHAKFKTLVTAVEHAELVDTLKGPGPYTVFAPDNAAFSKLPEGALDELLKNQDKLKSILLFHVVSGKLTLDDLAHDTSLTTVNGGKVPVTVHSGVHYVGHARIVGRPIKTGNGYIYTITEVLMPPDAAEK